MKNAVYLQVSAEVRYWEDATVNGAEDDDGTLMPLRVGALWCPRIRLNDGVVMDWPTGTIADVHYKVCDQGEYFLLDAEGRPVGKWRGYYVPDDVLAVNERGYGDYIILTISAEGRVQNWRVPTLSAEDWPTPTPPDGGTR